MLWVFIKQVLYITMHGPQNVKKVFTMFTLVLYKWSAVHTTVTHLHT